jgi:hypothetical protein
MRWSIKILPHLCHRGGIEFLSNEVFRLEEVLTQKVREHREMQSVMVVGAGDQDSTSTSEQMWWVNTFPHHSDLQEELKQNAFSIKE